jgi:HAD superfamily hydrolase (TIGR01459 family)
MSTIPIISSFSEIASSYDALICDVWGVLHNGHRSYAPAIDALYKFRAECGPVILLTNAPRPSVDVETMLKRVGAPIDCYDGVVSSGAAARHDVEQRIRDAGRTVKVYHLGPDRDGGVLGGLDIERVDVPDAEIVLCTGLYDDTKESADDYVDLFARMKTRELTMLCANPDIVVQRGNDLIWCAGALAQAYEKIGGRVIYYGKPHRPVYDICLAMAAEVARREIRRPLAVGDGADTDIRGANMAGIDALFVAQGIHAAQLGPLTAEGLAQLFVVPEAHPIAAIAELVW